MLKQAFIDIVKEKMNVELKASNDTNADITINEETPRANRPNTQTGPEQKSTFLSLSNAEKQSKIIATWTKEMIICKINTNEIIEIENKEQLQDEKKTLTKLNHSAV